MIIPRYLCRVELVCKVANHLQHQLHVLKYSNDNYNGILVYILLTLWLRAYSYFALASEL